MTTDDSADAVLTWSTHRTADYVLASFRVNGGLLKPADLGRVRLPVDPAEDGTRGLVLSGAGPVWLYGHLVHLGHAFAWVAVHDPRYGAAVVVERHREGGPRVGEQIALETFGSPAADRKRARKRLALVVALVLLAVAGVFVSHWAAAALEHAGEHWMERFGWLAAAALFAVALVLRAGFARHLKDWAGAALATLGVVFAVWSGTSSFRVIESLRLPTVWLIVITTLAAVGSAFVLYYYQHLFRSLFERAQFRGTNASRRCLIFFLSRQEPARLQFPAESTDPTAELLKSQHVTVELPARPPQTAGLACRLDRQDLMKDAQCLADSGLRWNWEMTMRAMAAHQATLDEIILIGSRDVERTNPKDPKGKPLVDLGSFRELELCKSFLQSYLDRMPLHPKATTYPRPVDFEEIKELDAVLRELLAGRDPKDVSIDVTGGQKTTSIAGAIATLNNDVMIQYVQTGRSKEARRYDLVWHVPAGQGH